MKMDKEKYENMKPSEFRKIVREGKWTDTTENVCQGYAQANLVILPKEYAYEFLLVCQRNPRPCPVLEVTEAGDPYFKELASNADVRTDLPLYRVVKDGEIVDEPTDIQKYWKKDFVAFLLGCSRTFVWALKKANVSWRRYGAYRSNIPCKPAGRLHGHMVVGVRAFDNSKDAVRAIQISSRHPLMHGAPVFIGDPSDIGIDNLGKPDKFNPYRPSIDPPKKGEIIMYWGCGVTPQLIAMESKIPFMITHSPSHMFVTDKLGEELAIF